jgi:hypothetical protein
MALVDADLPALTGPPIETPLTLNDAFFGRFRIRESPRVGSRSVRRTPRPRAVRLLRQAHPAFPKGRSRVNEQRFRELLTRRIDTLLLQT